MRHLTLLPLVVLLAGCGGGDGQKGNQPVINVRGKLMDGKNPWTLNEAKTKLPPGVSAPPVAPGQSAGGIQMAFISDDGGDVMYGRVDTAAGTFEVKGMKPGRYKIALYSSSMTPTGGGAGGTDPFGGKFTQDKTRIVRDLTTSDEITIDVSKPTG